MPNSSLVALLFIWTASLSCSKTDIDHFEKTQQVIQEDILKRADKHLSEKPITITAQYSSRSAGGIHDFYSEGDYWWPDSTNLDGPYVRRDGMTNPDNFVAHREAVMRFSELAGNLTSAFLMTKEDKYADAVIRHCQAWFIDEKTKMNPHMLYAQAIKGRVTGRGIGIIDGIHFIEVVQSLIILDKYGKLDDEDIAEIRNWFSEFLMWLTEHPYGIKEMNTKNNHAMCWNMQAGIYAVFTNNEDILNSCRNNFTQTLLPNQMATDGSFPLELARTKPYGYALFNLDAMVMNAVILSSENHDLFSFETQDGKSIRKGLEYMAPYVADKSTWQLEPDVLYWEEWPVAHPSFLVGSFMYNKPDYFELWKSNNHFPEVFEVKRNMPIKSPLIWIDMLN